MYKLGLKHIVNFNGKLVEVNKHKFDIFQNDAGAVKASRHQFPLKLAFALTVHRAQGQTLPCVEVDWYIASLLLGNLALQWSVSADKLRVLNYNVSAVSKHQPEVYEYYKRLTVGQCYTD